MTPTAILMVHLSVLLGILSATVVAETKKFVTPDNYTWVYDHVSAKDSKPTVLLLHGFPSSRHDWSRQVEDLSAKGYGVIAPDLLGFGDSDRPTDTHNYRIKVLSQDIDAILGHEGLDTVVGVGHDWGSTVLSGLAVFYPKRFEKIAFTDIGYTPTGFLDVDAINAQALQDYGYTIFGYFYLFNSFDAPDLLRANIESAWHLVFPPQPSVWRNNLASIGGARAWLNYNTTTAMPAYRSQSDKAAWIKHYSVPGNLEAALNSYKSQLRGTQVADFEHVTEAQKAIKVPVLGVVATQDPVGRPDILQLSTKPYAVNGYTEKSLACGHWVMLEKGKELSEILIDFAAQK